MAKNLFLVSDRASITNMNYNKQQKLQKTTLLTDKK